MAYSLDNQPCSYGLGALAFIVVLLFALWKFYQYLLPQPIPGIPFNPEALTSILGDVPDLMRDEGGAMDWLLEQSRRHQGPVCQVFLRPFSKPYVLLSDFREAEDIMMRRREWDRSDYSIDLLGGQAPYHHINEKTGPVWKAHRRLIQDLMMPDFLNNVAAPNIYSSTLDLVHLWTAKARLAGGRPFSAEQDVFYASLDAVLEFSFGASFPHRAIPPQRSCIDGLTSADLGSSPEGAVDFPDQAVHQTIQSTLRASEVVGELVDAPFPRLSWWLKSCLPAEAKHVRTRHAYVKEQILRAVDRLESEKAGTDDAWVKSAVDLMMRKEQQLAEKEGRPATYWSPAMRDEVFGFVIGGHDTLSTTILWGLKFLADHPRAQEKLRRDLYRAHAEAFEHKRMPTAEEITKRNTPYLDATIKEILRLSSSIAVLDRQATCDTELLGHHIPKGTIVMMLNRGPSFTEPALSIEESVRSASCQAASSRKREWPRGNESAFLPDRWCEDNRLASGSHNQHCREPQEGHSRDSNDFNASICEPISLAPESSCGPSLPFGLGQRGCYGRKLALLELRIVFTLLIWRFDLGKCPEDLSGYAAVESLTHKPKQCFVSLRRLDQ